ncbi:ABC transporter ATP-binding protein [Oceanispirochaeta sp.]|jgi:ATP-binding cassette subfamily B multidrug efflux pump|uniref:ABC transporter ATP-binding protein n=1 Tax=Oceanispirochaeta sp. TaxID=2035350 RepID=UPI0026043757|nr:ABC transporter ATP-binding protein [Oceanispirochaeta sp.]MDA3958126.1 ABC transporter ATP-binding protein [Oceanispirochaeta sp.]
MKVPEENEKDIDSRIIKKLMKFTDKYRHWFILAIAALILSTVAELALPVILQQSIDRNIMAHWTWISADLEVTEKLVEGHDNYRDKENRVFILESELRGINSRERTLYQEQGMMADESWYVFQGDSVKDQILGEMNQIVSLEKGKTAVPHSILKSLDQENYKSIRAQDVMVLKKRAWQYFMLLLVILVFTFLQIFLMSWTSQGVMKDIRSTMLSHIMKQSLSYLGETPIGSLVSRITSDVETINEFFTSVTISILKDIAIMAGVLVTLFFLNPLLALVTLLTIPPVLLASFIFRKMARSAFRRQRHWISRVNSFLSEHVSGMEVIQIFGREKETRDQFGEDNEELLKASMSEMYIFAVFRPLVDLFSSVTLAIVIYAGAAMLNRHILSLGILIAFIDLIQKFYRPVMDMSEKFSIMQSAMAGGERVFSLLEESYEISDKGINTPEEKIEGKIEFKNVCFSYKPGEPVIRDLSFVVHPGETVAIVGYTGAGKTTIASLATRLWDIDSGTILLDETPLEDYSLAYLRQSIQAVQQDVFLFSGTIKENITLGSPIDDATLMKAAETVQVDRFIDTLDKKYNTELQERGKNLSGGQKQLLSFARAVAHNPVVLILDEATANIDTETEKLIQKAMDNLLIGRTSLVIAHRISTIMKADRILVLSEGRLVESGSHEELLTREGLYYNLYNYQYASSEMNGI